MKVTTESIIKMLPFEFEFKKNLLDSWDSMSSDQKLDMTETLWDAYSAVYDILFEKNMQEAFLKVTEGADSADSGLYDKVKNKTEEEIQHLDTEGSASVDLSNTREELEKLLNNTPN